MRTIKEYFERIEASMTAGDVLLARRDPTQAATVRAKCTEAALLIGSYQMFVHREVFEPLMNSPDAALRRQVCHLKAECIALTEDLRSGVKAMAARDAPVDHLFVAARVREFNDRVRAHMAAIMLLLDSPRGVSSIAA